MSIFNWFAPAADINKGVETFRQTPGAVLLDVRTPEEYADGHIPGSVNLPQERTAEILVQKDAPLFVYCYSGSRSAAACGWLKKHGYQAVNIGGIMNYHGTVEKGKGGTNP